MELALYKSDWIDFALLLIFLVPIVIADIKEKRIPDRYTFLGMSVFFIKRIIEKSSPVYLLLLNSVIGFAFIFLLFFFQKAKSGLAMQNSLLFWL